MAAVRRAGPGGAGRKIAIERPRANEFCEAGTAVGQVRVGPSLRKAANGLASSPTVTGSNPMPGLRG